MRPVRLIAAAAAAAVYLLPATTAHAATPAPPTGPDVVAQAEGCQPTSTLVRLTPTSPPTTRVAGWWCQPHHATDPDTAQVLVHGFTYNHLYWMGLGAFPHLDYVRYAARAGHTSFVIDQVGAGRSDHPDPATVTIPVLAFVLTQLVTDLRTGRIGGGHRVRHVVGVGHSMGAAEWLTEAASYHDVDAVVLADFLHDLDTTMVNGLIAHNILAANTRPRFADLPAGYLTAEPRTVFYDTTLAPPQVIARDEQVGADTGTSGQLASINTARDPATSAAITAPVLVVTGRQDTFACNPSIGLLCATPGQVIAREGPDYPASRCLAAFVVDAGHDTNLHPAAPAWFRYANWWITQITAPHQPSALMPAGVCAVQH